MELKEILKSCFGMKEEQYQDEQQLMGLTDWDSMNHMLFITQLEGDFGIELTGDEIAEIRTIGDIKKALSSRGKSA